ncbi:MAG: TonB-dependent receptor [Sandaracinaceae bacterium]
MSPQRTWALYACTLIAPIALGGASPAFAQEAPPTRGEAPEEREDEGEDAPRDDAGPDSDEPAEPSDPASDDPSDETASDEEDSEDDGADDASVDDEALDDDAVDDLTVPDAPMADTGLRGRVVDSRTGEGLPDAVVIARRDGGLENTITNETGGYVMILPPGAYSVLAYTDLYHGARMPRIVVRSGRWSDLTLTLDPIDAEAVAEEVEIIYRADTRTAAAQDQLRAASAGIGEGMGSQQMSQSGASDAGAAARNVAGVTLEGANLNIRGMGGAYTLVLLNGVQLPSTDPDSPNVDLDLFPSSVIENLFISKAFLPNLPGNFAGGVLDIRTVRFPQRFTLEAELGTGVNTLSTFQSMLGYRGGSLDFLGIDDGTRALPSGLDDRLTVGSRFMPGAYTSDAQIDEVARRFPDIWSPNRSLGVPDVDASLLMGDSVDLGGGARFGYLAFASYGYEQRRTTGVSRPRPTIHADDNGQIEELVLYNDYRYETGSEQAQLTGFGTASLELGQDHVLSFLTFYNRTTTDETSRTTGRSGELGGSLERWQLQMISRTVWFNQFRGDHRDLFGSHVRLRWSAYGAYAGRDEPDRRTVAYGTQGMITDRWLEKSQSGERFYSGLTQLDFGGTLELRIPLWSEGFGTIGGQVRSTQRDLANRRFRFLQAVDPAPADQSVYRAPAEEVLGPDGIGSLVRLREYTFPTDSYRGEQEYYAGFAMLETPIVDALSFTGGARLEAFHQYLSSRSAVPNESDLPPDPDAQLDRTDVDVLPSATLRLEVADGMFLRAAYGMTVRRANLRELAPYQYYDFINDRNISGNPALQRTLIQNADLRWEWFFGEGELLALSAFYKYLDQPIELQIRNSTSGDAAYNNASFAHNVGGELELRFNFRHLAPELSFLTFNGTFAAVWSVTTLPDALAGSASAERPLYGQSPYVANMSLVADEPGTGLSASLVYNLTGDRLTGVGVRENGILYPNIFRAPYHSLDLILGWQFHTNWQIKFKIRNLLFQQQEFHQGSFLIQTIDPGAAFNIGLEFTQ